jgi:hypothetical protein
MLSIYTQLAVFVLLLITSYCCIAAVERLRLFSSSIRCVTLAVQWARRAVLEFRGKKPVENESAQTRPEEVSKKAFSKRTG